MACDKLSSPPAADATAGKDNSRRVGVDAGSPRGGSRIQLQLTMCTEDGREKTGINIATPKQASQRILDLSLMLTASTL